MKYMMPKKPPKQLNCKHTWTPPARTRATAILTTYSPYTWGHKLANIWLRAVNGQLWCFFQNSSISSFCKSTQTNQRYMKPFKFKTLSFQILHSIDMQGLYAVCLAFSKIKKQHVFITLLSIVFTNYEDWSLPWIHSKLICGLHFVFASWMTT